MEIAEHITAIGREGSRLAGDADCAISGPASDPYLLLWNRRAAEGLHVEGDGSALTWWRDTVKVTWR